jgi:hypothetical protein
MLFEAAPYAISFHSPEHIIRPCVVGLTIYDGQLRFIVDPTRPNPPSLADAAGRESEAALRPCFGGDEGHGLGSENAAEKGANKGGFGHI